ncbi:MAG TPA: ribbon-helix-helix domain-containing protein [Blastocatellia bacterium]|nr:ribbon-helix-helix domain-containing protein [Blastocatellia bacterium]
MRTAVSIPEELFRQAEELAAALGLSRSELYAAALAEFIRQQHGDHITERLNQVYAENDSEMDPVLEQMQSVSLPVEQW